MTTAVVIIGSDWFAIVTTSELVALDTLGTGEQSELRISGQKPIQIGLCGYNAMLLCDSEDGNWPSHL